MDVARLAGVHVSTVSRVLRDSPQLNIRPETRLRIKEAADQLGYRPNAVARALRLASTGAIGMLLPSLRNPVYAVIARGAFQRAWERNFVVMLAEDRGGGDAEMAYERLVQSGRIDGLLIAGAHQDSILPQRASESPVPFVFVNRRAPGGHNVAMREEDAGALAAEHLLGLGHRELAHIAGPEGIDTAKRRVDGFMRATRRRDVSVRIVHAAFDERAGHARMLELLTTGERPTAVFTTDFNQGIGALAAARELGLAVPGDLSVVAYGEDPIGDFMAPPLTCIRMPMHEMGAAAVDAILCRIEGRPAADVIVPVPPEIVLRSSTGPPPA
jgi:LacI family transcriptional regulator